jgi:DNA topoisomerase I
VPRLRRSNCASPGIERRRRGRGVRYVGPDGNQIDDPEVLERIAELVIPPAWREVWICLDPRGHLQATGIDAAGRKQYRYHDQWRAHRDRLKFDSMVAFGSSLPKLRRRVAKDLRGASSPGPKALADEKRQPRGADLTRPRVLACAVRLLDLGFFRIGSEDYTERNDSYGLTTMLRSHVSLHGREIVFDYTAKSGVRRVQAITDEPVREIVAALKRRRGGTDKLLFYRTERGWSELHSGEVNDYVKLASGGEFTAKDFRTWNATLLAAVALAVDGPRAHSKAARERAVTAAVKTVAAYLGNTPAVCRASYIDPRIIDRYHAGVTIAAGIGDRRDGPHLENVRTRNRIERAVLELLRESPDARPRV